MPEADIYVRVSTKVQKEEGTSLESQIKACRTFAEQKGYSIAEVFQEDWPGDTLERPCLDQVRSRVRNRTVSAVVIYVMDRLARDPILQAIIALDLEKHQVDLLCVLDPPVNSPEDQLLRYIKGYASAIERAQIRERTMRGRKERALNGKLPTGSAGLYGYDYSKQTGKRSLNEEEAKIIRMVFQWLVEDDLTLGKICIKLTEMGIPSPKGTGHWGRSTIGRLVRQEAYTGVSFGMRYIKVESPNSKAERKRYKKNRTELRDPSEWIPLPDATPPIIDHSTFDRAAQILSRHQKFASRHTKGEYLLAGRVRCGLCGRAFGVNPHYSGHFYYRCQAHSRVVDPQVCRNKAPNGEKLDRQVWTEVSETLKHPDWIISEVRRRQQTNDESALAELLGTIDTRLKKLKDQETRLAKLYTLGDLDDAAIRAAGSSLKSERKSLEEERQHLLTRIDQAQSLKTSEETIRAYCNEVSANIEELQFSERRQALQALDISVIIYPDKAVVQGFVPSGFVSQPS